MTTEQSLLFSSEEGKGYCFLKHNPLITDRASEAQEMTCARTIIIATRSSSRTKRTARIIMGGEYDTLRGIEGGWVVTDDIGSKTREEIL